MSQSFQRVAASFGLMFAVASMLACTRADNADGSERLIYKVSSDGRHLEGYAANKPTVPVGSVDLPAGAVWSVAGLGDSPQVWIHSRESVRLVDTRQWRTVATWTRNDAVADVQLARGGEAVVLPSDPVRTRLE
jgi:hypothetical protein